MKKFERQSGNRGGWTIQYELLKKVHNEMNEETNEVCLSLEDIEDVLLAVEKVMEANCMVSGSSICSFPMNREKMVFETWIDKFEAEKIINDYYDDEDIHYFLSALDKFKYFEVRIFGSKKGWEAK